jgi:hypothetical protein
MIFLKYISFICGLTIYMILSAPESGYPNKLDTILGFSTSLCFKIPFLPIKIHIHHWLYLFIISMIVYNQFIRYFCYGGMLQGILMYDDFYKIIYFIK